MNLKDISFEITNQLKTVFRDISNQKYAEKIELLSESSIGQHLRHVIECFDCFLTGYETGKVNYDIRERNRQIESDTLVAIKALNKIEGHLLNLDLNIKLILEMDFDLSENSLPILIDTTAGRELAYNIEHAIHHMALIKIGLKHLYPEIELPENFGVAYSTIKYQSKVCVQ